MFELAVEQTIDGRKEAPVGGGFDCVARRQLGPHLLGDVAKAVGEVRVVRLLALDPPQGQDHRVTERGTPR